MARTDVIKRVSVGSAARILKSKKLLISDVFEADSEGVVDFSASLNAENLSVKPNKLCNLRCLFIDEDKTAIVSEKAFVFDVKSLPDVDKNLSLHIVCKDEAFVGKKLRVAVVKRSIVKPFIIGGFIIAVSAIAAIIILDPWGDPRARKGYYEGKTKEEIQKDLDEQVAWYSMEISIASYMEMHEGEKEVEARIENVEANHCDQKVKIYENGHPDDVLYESGAIAPGEYIQNIELAHPLDVGVHKLTVEFQGYEQNMTLLSDEGQLFGHDTFGASCAAEVTLYVAPEGVMLTKEAEELGLK